MYKSVNILRNCLRNVNRRQSVFAATNNDVNSSPHDKDVQQLYEMYKDKIHYSTVFEDKMLKLGYRKRKLYEQIADKLRHQEGQLLDNYKPFPLSLRFLKPDINESITSPEDEIVDKELTEFKQIQSKINENLKKIAMLEEEMDNEIDLEKLNRKPHWMHDYELFDESSVDGELSEYGTPDPKIPISKIPCGGCGAVLHCADTSLPGYLPSELFKKRTDDELKRIICQRCHFLKNYNTAINVRVSSDEYIEIVSSIKDKYALVILIIDLLDFPCSIWPKINTILNKKRPVFLVGNKVDLLPQDSADYLQHIKECLKKSALANGLEDANIQHVSLISATTGYGIEELITQLHHKWGSKGDVYLVGCTNVGKSSLFNTLLQSDYCKSQASNLIQKATASPWPGTTLRLLKFPILRPSDMRVYLRTKRLISERGQKAEVERLRKLQAKTTGDVKHATLIGHIGRTFEKSSAMEINDPFSFSGTATGNVRIATMDENNKIFSAGKWCYDTPGVMNSAQISKFLTTEELVNILPRTMIRPRTFLVKPKMSLFLGGLGRLDYLIGENSIRMTVYSSSGLPIVICETGVADEIYQQFLGTEMFGVPIGCGERLQSWPELESSEKMEVVGESNYRSTCDVVLSSAGWIGLDIPENEMITIQNWTLCKDGVFVRNPPLIPFGAHLKGKRIRGSLAYKNTRPFK